MSTLSNSVAGGVSLIEGSRGGKGGQLVTTDRCGNPNSAYYLSNDAFLQVPGKKNLR